MGVRLKYSHFLPAGLYRVLHSADGRHIVIRPDRVLESNQQWQAHILCNECEGRFNSRGESWVIANGWRAQDDFPLLERLQTAQPVSGQDPSGGFIVYDGRAIEGVRMDQLVYFAASVFWRAAIHGWGRTNDGPVIELRSSTIESLRLFLLDSAEFPDDVTLMVATTDNADGGGASDMMSPPARRNVEATWRTFDFHAPGLIFALTEGAPQQHQAVCSVRTGLICVSPNLARVRVAAGAKNMKTAKVVGRLSRKGFSSQEAP